MEEKVLIIDDEAYDNKCRWIIEILEERQIKYEIALNLNQAFEKIIDGNIIGIILDGKFPISEESEKQERLGESVINKIEEMQLKIPVFGNSRIPFETQSSNFWGQIGIFNMKQIFNNFLTHVEETHKKNAQSVSQRYIKNHQGKVDKFGYKIYKTEADKRIDEINIQEKHLENKKETVENLSL